jgi:uncharacterized protein (DUF1501 family)
MTCSCPEYQSGMTRRGFLRRAAAAGAAGAAAAFAGDSLAGSLAYAAPGYTGDVLVVLSLRGGFDGLSAVVPHGDPSYYQARPTIGIPKARLIGGNSMFGLHPALAPLLPWWNAGKLAAVHAVGQKTPTRSHFAAMEAMERAAPGTSIRTGWIDRMLGVQGATSPMGGVSIGSLQPQSFAGPAPKLGLSTVAGFAMSGDTPSTPMAATLRQLYEDAPPLLATPAANTLTALTTTAQVSATPYTPANGAAYPNTELGHGLSSIAQLIKADVGLMTAAVDYGDWDMHENLGTATTGQRMHTHLADFATTLAAFATDLGSAGLAKVTLITLSEFGRRVGENASRGLDHGNGNAMFVLGGGVRGKRVYGSWPGLAPAKLVDGDLRGTTDYRSVIGEILQKRCGHGSLAPVFPGVKPTSFGLVTARTG